MLSSKALSQVLGSALPEISIKDIHWRTQDSTPESVLFYKIGSDLKSEELFTHRIKETKFGLLVVNRIVGNLPANSTVVDEARWPEVQHQILNHFYPLPPMKLIGNNTCK